MNCLRCDAKVLHITGYMVDCRQCDFAWAVGGEDENGCEVLYWDESGCHYVPAGCLLVVRDYELPKV